MQSGYIPERHSDDIDPYIDPRFALDHVHHPDTIVKLAKAFLEEHREMIKGPVLEIGSGNGSFAAHIAETFDVEVVGLEASKHKINQAHQLYQHNPLLKFFEGNAVTMHYHGEEFRRMKFATIVSFNNLHHVPAHLQYLLDNNIHKKLTQHGRALFLIPGRCAELHEAIEDVAKTEHWHEYFQNFKFSLVSTYESATFYQAHLMRSNFYRCDVSQETLDGGVDLNLAEVKQYLRGWLPHLEYLTAHHGDACLADLSEQLLQEIAVHYFKRMDKELNLTVHPTITLNKIVAYASKQSFFSLQSVNNSAGRLDTETDTPRLQAKL
jgi:SAM-dependent methyltransferase